MGSSLLFPATSVTGVCWSRVQVKVPRFCVRASLDTNVSDMSVNAPKCLFPPEPEHYRGPKLKVAIIGAGLAGMSTAGELLDQGHENMISGFQSELPYMGFAHFCLQISLSFLPLLDSFLMYFASCIAQVQTYDKARNALALALSPVVRALVDPDGALKDVGDLDSISFSDWFLSKGGTRTSIQRMWDPVAYALLRMLKGSPDATDKKVVQAEAYVTACDVPGIKRLLPSSWREMKFFNNIYELVGVPVVTVQLRYNGWVTELQDLERSRCVLTPGDTYMPLPNDEIIRRVAKQVLALFPLSQGLEVIWSFVVKIGQFLYHEGPGKDPFRPDQKTQVKNLFLAGSYTKQDYIDIMEGASLSGRQASAYICNAREELVALRKQLAAFESQEQMEVPTTTNDDLSLV
ncbi:Zeta-carotene desaturase /chromoplastic [Citrus sinensis]|nr:Zeta-carotene desaturase /chromoplastic [Citrus sinensis]